MSVTSEARRSLISSVLVLALAAVFFAFFQLTKQVPELSSVNASAVDPYDAIGSFGVQTAAFLGALSVVRAFWWSRDGVRSNKREAVLAGTQVAAVLAVAVTLAGDVVAMLRHVPVWLGVPAGTAYASALLAVAVMAALVGFRVLAGSSRASGPPVPGAHAARVRAGIGAAVFVVVLASYPETVTSSIPGAMLTIVIGVVLLFVPVRLLTLALVPRAREEPAAATRRRRPGLRGWRWALVAALGVLAGLALVAVELLAEAGTATPPPLARIAVVVSVYVGVETSGLLIGYALLRGPLGLGHLWRVRSSSDDTHAGGQAARATSPFRHRGDGV
jgi:hypothetical protein